MATLNMAGRGKGDCPSGIRKVGEQDLLPQQVTTVVCYRVGDP